MEGLGIFPLKTQITVFVGPVLSLSYYSRRSLGESGTLKGRFIN